MNRSDCPYDFLVCFIEGQVCPKHRNPLSCREHRKIRDEKRAEIANRDKQRKLCHERTYKQMGCGGRYSAYSFYPCRICLAETDEECQRILKQVRTPKHEEYYNRPNIYPKHHGEIL